jgi:hypothetical protein
MNGQAYTKNVLIQVYLFMSFVYIS